MFGKHPDNQFVAYLQGQLSRTAQQRLEIHLQRCAHCRQALEQLRAAERLLSDLPLLTAPPTLWDRIHGSLPIAAVPGGDATPFVTRSRHTPLHHRRRWNVSLRLAACIVVIGLFILWPHRNHIAGKYPPGPTWLVTNIAGQPKIDSSQIGKTERMAAGQWLETDSRSRAEIAIADIGKVEVAPNTRIGLLTLQPNHYRLSLPHGDMSVRVNAPPRLFLVDTPSATAVDMGCAYTLHVDPSGAGVLHVTLGHVALPLPATTGQPQREVTVPMDAFCRIRKGLGPGTPCSDFASPAFQKALDQFDSGQGDDTALTTLLKEAHELDTLTLWHLIYRGQITGAQRTRILDRTLQLVPLPKGVTRAGLLQGNSEMLTAWHNDLTLHW